MGFRGAPSATFLQQPRWLGCYIKGTARALQSLLQGEHHGVAHGAVLSWQLVAVMRAVVMMIVMLCCSHGIRPLVSKAG